MALLESFNQQEQQGQQNNHYEDQSGLAYHSDQPPPYQSPSADAMHGLSEYDGWQFMQNQAAGYSQEQGYTTQEGYWNQGRYHTQGGFSALHGHQFQNDFAGQNIYPNQHGRPMPNSYPAQQLQSGLIPSHPIAQTPMQHHPHQYTQDGAQIRSEEEYKARSRKLAFDNARRSVNGSAVGFANGRTHLTSAQHQTDTPKSGQSTPGSSRLQQSQALPVSQGRPQSEAATNEAAPKLTAEQIAQMYPAIGTPDYQDLESFCVYWCTRLRLQSLKRRWVLLDVKTIWTKAHSEELQKKWGLMEEELQDLRETAHRIVGRRDQQQMAQGQRPQAPMIPNVDGHGGGMNASVRATSPKQPAATPRPNFKVPAQPATSSEPSSQGPSFTLPRSMMLPEQPVQTRQNSPPPVPTSKPHRQPSKPG